MTYTEYKEYCEEEEMLMLPEKVFNICQMIEKMFNIGFSFEDIEYFNRGGYVYAKAAGFRYSYCTFSVETGPDLDYREEIAAILKGLGFEIANSYGNNGLDPAANYGDDCYWHYEFAYSPSKKWIE